MFQPVTSAIHKWRRFVLRLWDRQLWHLGGLLLWLCAHSSLRFLPYPYPSIATVQQWQLQAQAMVSQHTLISRHLEAANSAGAFTAQNLIEMSRFRDRVGWSQAFLEDSLLSGFLAVKAMRGQKYQLKKEAMAEAQRQAQKDIAAGTREDAARQLIGPRGGLPTLRADLIRLASLLEVELDPKDTVAMIQKKVRPMVEVLKATSAAPKSRPSSSATSATAAAAAPAALGTPPSPSMKSWRSAGPTLEEVEQRIQEVIGQQEQRFQTMLMPVLRHIIHQQSPGSSAPAETPPPTLPMSD